jgi:toxin ParE1/3/4
MGKFVLTNKAKSDLKSIAKYTSKNWGRKQRNKYLYVMDGTFCDLAEEALIGQKCFNISNKYYKYQVGKHIIFYHKIEKNMIEVVRILHQKMDIESHL